MDESELKEVIEIKKNYDKSALPSFSSDTAITGSEWSGGERGHGLGRGRSERSEGSRRGSIWRGSGR